MLKLDDLSNKKIPIYITDCRICFNPEEGKHLNSVFLITTPKSGTYLFGEILKRLGFNYCNCQISDHDIFDQRFGTLDDYRVNPEKYLRKISFNISSQMILNGQYAIGHIPYNKQNYDCLLKFNKIFTYRDMRNSIVSCAKYYSYISDERSKNPNVPIFKNLEMSANKVSLWLDIWGEEYAGLYSNMIQWLNVRKVTSFNFDELFDNGPEIIKRIAKSIGVTVDNTSEIIKDVLKTKTVTSSGKRTDYKQYWNKECEQKYLDLNFAEIDTKLGFK